MTDATERIKLFKIMVLARTLDDRMAKLKAQGEVAGSAFLGRGQEAFSGAAGLRLRPGDVFAPLIRDQAGRLAFGETPLDVTRTVLGRRTGPMRGRDGNVHRGDWTSGRLPMISHLGAMVSAVVGILLARRIAGRQTAGDLNVGVAAIGDGGMNTGALHEALNAAAIERLPLVLLVADNQYAYSTTSDRTYACKHLVERAVGYGVVGHRCDGTDADACLDTVGTAIADARSGKGPQMVVADLLRLAGHGTHDDASYVADEVKSRFGDCLQLHERTLSQQGILDVAAIAAIRDEARIQVEAAVEQARGEPQPEPQGEDWSARCEQDLVHLRSR
jgi:acetoin:2,6-dichlorophenolindophenol oxidoreductase subunit alpha